MNFRVVVKGRLSERFAAAFEGVALEARPGETVLVGRLTDEAQLRALLDRLADFGVEPVRVERLTTPSTRRRRRARDR